MSTFTSTFTASNGAQSKTLAYTFTVYATSPITLSATFPTSPKVGDAVNFDVTATLANGATGTLTITQDTLPAGLSLGATSQVDANHYKATVSGTLTTAATGTTNFGATGGSVAAQELAWNWTVSAAPSGPTRVALVQAHGSSVTGAVGAFDFPAVDIKAGDLLVVQYTCPFNRYITTLSDGQLNSYGVDIQWNSVTGTKTDSQIWHAVANADATSVVLHAVLNGTVGAFSAFLLVYRKTGTTWGVDTPNVKHLAAVYTNTAVTTPVSTSGPAIVSMLIGNDQYDNAAVTTGTWTGATKVADGPSGYGGVIGTSGEYIADAALSGMSMGAGFDGSYVYKDLLAVPFTFT
ncbi:MAG TPA: hypothetical protein VFP92_10940 [Rhodanobacteraceae bacterium]|nr:hypothetical protein [Rhodanobacteraceae bacterium]